MWVAFVLGGFLTSIRMCPLIPGQLSRARGQSGDLEHHGPCIPGDQCTPGSPHPAPTGAEGPSEVGVEPALGSTLSALLIPLPLFF